MRKNTTLSTLVKISMLLLLASVSKISFGQACDPKWNRLKSSNCENSPIQFEANSPGRTTFEWDYGDGQSSGSGTTSAYRDPVHAYAKAGTYTVVFKGSGGAGPCSDTVMITIKESPVVKLKALYNSSQCFAGNKFCFVDSTKAATGSKILTLKYLFSDGALYTINDPKGGDTICHSVIDPNGGYFDLTIEAEDYNGCVTKIRYDKFIRVFPKIGVNFKSNAPNACIKSLATITNLTDTFTKLTDIARFTWNFGDPKDPQNIISGDSITNTQWWRGPSGNGVIQHTYDVSGRKSGTYVFNGSLTVTTKYGCTETFTFKGSATISILNVRIIAEDDSACSSDPEVKFTAVDAGSGDPITGVGSFLWNFGDPPSGPANFDKTTLIGAPHNYGLGPWMTSLNIKAGPCNITVFDTITKVGPTSSIERPFTRVPEDEKYQCIIKDSVHFTNVSTFYHTDPNPVFEDSSAVYRYYTLFSSRKVPYYQLPLTEDTIGPYATYRGVATTITRFYLENDTLETFPQSALTADSIIFYVKGKKVKRAVSNPIISGQDTMVIKKQKEYAFKWPGDQTAINSVFAPPTQRHKDHVLRLWTFGDNYAPKCTTDTRRNKNVGLNCNFSLDSLPVHWYTPWDQIYKYYNGGQFFSTPAEKTVLCKGGRFCYKVRYYPRDSFEIPADTLVILPYGTSYNYGNKNISTTDLEKMEGSFRIKRVRDINGPGYYTATLSDEEWTFNVQGPIGVKNITTGVTYQLSSGKHKLKIGDQFELYKGDDAKLAAQVVITAGKKIKAVPTTICIDTIIGGRDTFIQRSRTFIDSSFHRTNFFTKSAQCNTVALYHEDTIHALRCKSISQISLALLPPNAKGLEFKGVRCYAPPSPPYGMEFDVGKTKPGCTQRLLKFNFDSASGKNNWVSHGGFLAPPLPGSAPWHLGYQLSGAYPTKFVKPYGAGEINNRNPGWVTVGVVIGNGRWLDKTGPLDSIECIDTFWYHNAFRYLYLDSRFTVISPEKDKKTVCVGDTITFQLFDPLMDSITSLVWNWNDDEGSYYEERFFYYKPYKGPNNNRNDKTITDWKPSDKWLYNYVIRLEYDGFSYKTIDTLVTAVIRKWSIGVDISRAGDALKRAFEGLGLNMNEIPSADIPFYFGNGTGFGCIDTTGLGSLISFGVTPYRDALTFSRHRPDQVIMKGKNGSDSIYMENWYRYTDYTKKDSTIISESFHWRAKSMAGFDTLKQVNPNRYSQLRVTPGVFRHVYKKANRYFPTFQLRNTEGCFGPRNKEVDVGFFWNWTYSDTVICHGTDVVLRDSIRYFAYEDPFVWLDPKAYWMDPNRFVKLREWKKIDFNEHNDTLTSQKFDVTGLGIPPFRWHYDDPGIYTIRIAMKDSVGCMDTAKQKVYVTGVKAGFKALNAGGLSCKNILSFSDTSKVIDPCMITKGIKCDEIVEWTWDFGDGKRKSKLTNPSHDYTQNGTFTVRLKVRTRLGCEDSASMMITINGPRPYFNPISDTIVCVGDSVIFENLSYEPLFSPTWEWNFGDGKVASANTKTSVGHRYNAPGTYKVYLTQFDVINGTSIRCSAIYPDTSSELVTKIERIVKVKPVAPSDFDIAPNDTVCPNELVSFTSQSDTLYKRFSWRFGDGDTVNTNNPTASHAYSKTGSFKVIMIPDYDTPEFHKCLDTVKKDVVVVDVKADFDITPDDAPKFCFTNTSVGAVSYEWVFQDPRGDGSSTETDPCYTWQDTGCFNVTLFATNAIGCVDSITKQVCYKFVSKIIPYNVFTPEPADGINDVFRVNAEGLDKFDIIIYNRWGEVVFESKDQFFQWNGKVKNKGAECPEGTYFYIMNYKIKNKELNDGQKKPISGTVTLIRGKK